MGAKMSEMTAKTYQEFVKTTAGAFKPLNEEEGRVAAAALGLVGEAGETSEALKKWLFHGHELVREKIAGELGDVMWYVTELCNALDLTLEEVMKDNVEKLSLRYGGEWTTEKSVARVDTKND
jgi:phosphoribosyl-ATP pyrophosphohydrolase